MADETIPDLKLDSADAFLQMDDNDLAKAFNFTAPKGVEVDAANPLGLEVDGEPAAETVLPPKVKAAPQEGKLPKPLVEIPALAPEVPEVVAPEAVAPPEGEVAEPEKPKPMAEFAAFDKDGELEVPPDLNLTYKANGKVRENVPLEKVVKMAQLGEYNAEREQQVLASKQFVAEAQQRTQQLEAQVAQYEAWYSKVLADEEFYQRAQEDYARQQSPQARVERAERQLTEERSRHASEVEAQQAAAFVQHNLVPRVTKLIEDNPTVSFEEVMGRYNLLIAPLMVRGQVPPQSLPAVQHLVDTELTHWAQQAQLARDLDKRKVTNQVAAAQTQTTLAKRQLARAQQPNPVSGTGGAAPKPKSFVSADEWLDAALPVNTEMD